MITLKKTLSGKILDIGGGGEGIIGRLYTHQVTAIDNCREELVEAPAGFEKLLMDATQLDFNDCSFDHVTSFYTLMFMGQAEQKQAILEATRILIQGGELHIWDCDIPSAYPEPFCIDLSVVLPNERISTTFGIGKMDTQTEGSIKELCFGAGLELMERSRSSDGFYLRFKKP